MDFVNEQLDGFSMAMNQPGREDLGSTPGKRLKYLRTRQKGWTQQVAAERADMHARTIAQYEDDKVPAIKPEVARLIKSYDTTLAFINMEIDDPGPDPFKRVAAMSEVDRTYLKILEDEFQAASRLHTAAEKEYEAAKRYRQEYERINAKTITEQTTPENS